MKKLLLSSAALLVITKNVNAANFAVITSPPVFLNVFILIISIGCIFGAFKIYSFVKGGHLSKSWQIFVLGFSIMAITQIGYLTEAFEIINIPSFIIPALMMISVGLFLYGIFETKKILG